MKKSIKAILISIGVLLALIIVSLIPWIFVLFEYFFGESPAKPEIRYGEFDYSLVYEVNGETKIINDTIVCEYAGISRNLDGKSVKWKSYIKGTENKDNYLISEDDEYRIYIYLPMDAMMF